MPHRLPLRSRVPKNVLANRLTAATVIAFSLTFVAAGIAMLAGLVPQRILLGSETIDASVVLLFVPLCALTLAILVEAVRATMTGSYRHAAQPQANPLEPWRPGQGEG